MTFLEVRNSTLPSSSVTHPSQPPQLNTETHNASLYPSLASHSPPPLSPIQVGTLSVSPLTRAISIIDNLFSGIITFRFLLLDVFFFVLSFYFKKLHLTSSFLVILQQVIFFSFGNKKNINKNITIFTYLSLFLI